MPILCCFYFSYSHCNSYRGGIAFSNKHNSVSYFLTLKRERIIKFCDLFDLNNSGKMLQSITTNCTHWFRWEIDDQISCFVFTKFNLITLIWMYWFYKLLSISSAHQKKPSFFNNVITTDSAKAFGKVFFVFCFIPSRIILQRNYISYYCF